MSARRRAIAAARNAITDVPAVGPYDHLLTASDAELRVLLSEPWEMRAQFPLDVRLRLMVLDEPDAFGGARYCY